MKKHYLIPLLTGPVNFPLWVAPAIKMPAQKKTVFIAAALTCLLLNACKKDSSGGTPTGSCKLTEVVTTGTADIGSSDPYTVNTTERLTYNDQHLLSGFSTQSQGKYSSNKTYTYNSNYSYQYDASGFLLKDILQTSGRDAAGKTNSRNYTNDYTYTNSKLTKKQQSYTAVDDGKTSSGSTTLTYEYNGEGKLTKYTFAYTSSDGSGGSSFTTYEYSGGKLSKLTYSDGRGGTVTPLIEVNAQGLMTKNVSGTTDFRYQYDAAGNLVRTEQYSAGKKTDVSIYETDGKQNAAAMFYPAFKGHPDIDFYMGKNSTYAFTGNLLKDERIYVDGAGVEKTSAGFYFTYTYNAHNLPSTSTRVYKNSEGKTIQQSSSSYTYMDCN